MLLQYPDDLLFCVPALLHLSPLLHITRELQTEPVEISGAGQTLSDGMTAILNAYDNFVKTFKGSYDEALQAGALRQAVPHRTG
jgi:hypothetical protein